MNISMQSLEKNWRIPISKCNLSDSWFWKSSQSTFILQRMPNKYISINKTTFYFFMVVLDFVYTFFNVAEILYMSLCYHWLMNVKRKKKEIAVANPPFVLAESSQRSCVQEWFPSLNFIKKFSNDFDIVLYICTFYL